jgi:hypothetical protein
VLIAEMRIRKSDGAHKLVQAAMGNEVIEYIQFKDRRDEDGQRQRLASNYPVLTCRRALVLERDGRSIKRNRQL